MPQSLLLSAAEDTTGGIAVVLPPWGEIFWSALVLLAIILVVGKYALPRIYGMLDQRQQAITEGLQAADRAKQDQATAARERQAILNQANAEAQEVRDRATTDGQRIVARARTEAQAESARILESAQRQIRAERQAAEISLRTDVGLLATELSERIVGEHLRDTALTTRVVDRFLDDLERESAPVGSTGSAGSSDATESDRS